MKKARGRGEVTELVHISETSPGSSFRELDDVFLQTQARIWLGEVLHVRFDDDISMADLIADGELLFQVSKLIWKKLVKKYTELKHSKLHIYERTSSGKSQGKYMPYPKVDSFLKICQILGLTGIDLFSPSDVVERRDTRRVCMCIRSLSIKARSRNLNVPDFDVVTYTIAMPTYVVGGIRRCFLEQPRYSSSNSSISSRGSYRQRSFSENSEQNHEPHYNSDEAESSLTEVEPDIPISRTQMDQSHSFDLDEDLLEESVDDNRLSLSYEDYCSDNGHEISTYSPRLSGVYIDSSNSSLPIPSETSELSPAVIAGVNCVSLKCESSQSFGQVVELTPESKLARISDVESCTYSQNNHKVSINPPRLSVVYMENPNSNMPIQNENLESSPEVLSGVNCASEGGDLTPESKLPTSGKFQENSTENSGTGFCNVQSSHSCIVVAELNGEFELEKSEDNFTHELSLDFDGPFSDCNEESRLLREGRRPHLNTDVPLSQFEEKIDGPELNISQSLITESIYESNLNLTGHVDGLLEEFSTSRETEAGVMLEREEVLKQSEDKVEVPSESCQKNKKPKEARQTGHKVITSVAGGITVVGVLLILLQLRRRSNERNHVILLRSEIDKTKEKKKTAKRNVDIQKPSSVYPGEWLKV